MDTTLTVRIAFASDAFADTPSWSDVSSDVIAISTKRGRQHQLDRFEAGTATILLNNAGGNYWPNNTDGDYYPNVKLGKRINIRATYNEVTYDEYTGFIRKWQPVWLSQKGMLHPCMQVECADLQRNLSRAKLNDGSGYSQEASGTRVGNVLDDVSWPAADRDIDTGKENIIASGALENVSAMDHLFAVQDSELSVFYIAGNGDATYKERGAWEDNESQATFGDSNLPIDDVEFSLDDDLLYNEIRLTREGGTEQTYSDSDSIDDYGLRTLARSGMLLTSDAIILMLCLYFLARFHDARMRVRSITIKPQTPGHASTLWPYMLGWEIGTRIALVLDEADINGEYFIEGIAHSYDKRRAEWITKYQLSDASQYYYTPDSQIAYLRPESNGDLIEWDSAVGGAHWETLDEATVNDSDYIWNSSNQSGGHIVDLFNLPSLDFSNATIDYVKVYFRVKQDPAGSGSLSFWPAIKTNGTVYYGDAVQPGTTWTTYSKTWTKNPNTGSDWTVDEVNALQAGIRGWEMAPAYDQKPYCSWLYVEIQYTPEW